MFYAKTHLPNGVEIKADLANVEFSSVCPICGMETPLEWDELPKDGDFSGHRYHCESCSKKIKPFIEPVPGQNYKRFDWESMLIKSKASSNLFNYALNNASAQELQHAWENISVTDDSEKTKLVDDELNRRNKSR